MTDHAGESPLQRADAFQLVLDRLEHHTVEHTLAREDLRRERAAVVPLLEDAKELAAKLAELERRLLERQTAVPADQADAVAELQDHVRRLATATGFNLTKAQLAGEARIGIGTRASIVGLAIALLTADQETKDFERQLVQRETEDARARLAGIMLSTGTETLAELVDMVRERFRRDAIDGQARANGKSTMAAAVEAAAIEEGQAAAELGRVRDRLTTLLGLEEPQPLSTLLSILEERFENRERTRGTLQAFDAVIEGKVVSLDAAAGGRWQRVLVGQVEEEPPQVATVPGCLARDYLHGSGAEPVRTGHLAPTLQETSERAVGLMPRKDHP